MHRTICTRAYTALQLIRSMADDYMIPAIALGGHAKVDCHKGQEMSSGTKFSEGEAGRRTLKLLCQAATGVFPRMQGDNAHLMQFGVWTRVLRCGYDTGVKCTSINILLDTAGSGHHST
jgi:hypothetical protein